MIPKGRVSGPTNDARVAPLFIPDLPGFVDFLAGQADVGGGSSVPNGNGGIPAALSADDLAPLLRGVVFVGEAALRQRFDFQPGGLTLTIAFNCR